MNNEQMIRKIITKEEETRLALKIARAKSIQNHLDVKSYQLDSYVDLETKTEYESHMRAKIEREILRNLINLPDGFKMDYEEEQEQPKRMEGLTSKKEHPLLDFGRNREQ